VLLADDSPTIQRVVELTFAGENVRIVAVGDGGAAIAALRKARPDVVLADIAMPGASGYDVLAFVRSQPSLADVPVLLLAGAFEPIDEAEVARKGGDGVMSKPFDPAALVDRVSELLSRGRGAAASPLPRPAAPSVDVGSGRASDRPAVATAAERDRYFEEIDQAFAAITRVARPPIQPAADEDGLDDAVPEQPVAAAKTLPVSAPLAPPPPPRSEAAASAAELDPASVPFSDAFAALLDAERDGTPLDALWKPALSTVPAAGVDLERLADLVARRVLEQLSDRTVRETVSDIVSATAERLVHEEIDRIKRHIK
jgi:CheY-like chemotaxis protein